MPSASAKVPAAATMSAHGIAAPRRLAAPRRPSRVQPRSSQRGEPRAREVGLGQIAVDEAHCAQAPRPGSRSDAGCSRRRRPAPSSSRRNEARSIRQSRSTTSRSVPSVHKQSGHAAPAGGHAAHRAAAGVRWVAEVARVQLDVGVRRGPGGARRRGRGRSAPRARREPGGRWPAAAPQVSAHRARRGRSRRPRRRPARGRAGRAWSGRGRRGSSPSPR